MEFNYPQAPLISEFKIFGLHGYKDVVLDMSSNVRIVIAENGSGKTTILSALYSFLTCKFKRLEEIEFDYIECTFNSSSKKIRLDKKLIVDEDSGWMLKNEYAGRIFDELSNSSEVDNETIWEYLTSSSSVQDDTDKFLNLVDSIYLTGPISTKNEVKHKLLELKKQFSKETHPSLSKISKDIRNAVGDIQILYLPTYRRIEKYFENDESPKQRYIRKLYGRSTKEKNYTNSKEHIRYGLADVETRLSELTEEIQRRSYQGFKAISAKIVNDLLTGNMKYTDKNNGKLPTKDTLKRFFSRLGENNLIASDIKIIEDIYDSEAKKNENKNMLLYFLSQLSNVIDQTRQLELVIELFVDHVNKYLSSTSDKKVIEYNSEKMKVLVKNTWTNQEVKFNDLSSGEKQVISLLYHLFLFESKKIVLIDEPELSLSIKWQERILEDIANASSCHQLLAITHSPFVFNNSLEVFASPLRIQRYEGKKFEW